jgi:hypothetical protein
MLDEKVRTKVSYGYMLVREIDQVWYSKVLSTNEDYKIVARDLRYRLLNNIGEWRRLYVFYETINANPSLITFNDLLNSNFAWCYVKRSSKYLYAIHDSYIGNLLYKQLDFLIDYIEYKTSLSKLSKGEIMLEYKQVFGASRIIAVKKWMVSDLLIKKQKNIKIMYTV